MQALQKRTFVTGISTGRPRKYQTNADRQRAYRQRQKRSQPRAPRHIVPLEVLWPTAQTLLRQHADTITRIATRDLRRTCVFQLPAAVCDTPGVPAVVAEIRAIAKDASTRLRAAARRLQALTADASEKKIPFLVAGDLQTTLRVNAIQKNSEGFCAVVGCWQARNGGPTCAAHDATGRATIGLLF